MRAKQASFISTLAMVVAAAALLAFAGCGGGSGNGGGGQASGQSGNGKLAAVVKLTGRVGGRMAARSAAAAVNVTITISGVYSQTNAEFPPVTTTYPVNLAQGYARVSLVNVPVGVNHLLTAVADWGSATETVKVVIPKVTQGEITTVTADQASTVVADAAILFAQQKGVRLADIGNDTISSIGLAVASYSTQVSYFDMTPENVLNFLKDMNVPAFLFVSPANASVVAGETLQFTALLYDANNMLMSPPPAAWNLSPLNIGSIVSAGGLLTASAVGAGNVTVSYLDLTANAEVSVISSCESDTDCGDGRPLTFDVCNNPNTSVTACTHTPVACNTRADCNDNVALTLDGCSNGGALNAACSHTNFACNDALDCDDNKILTIDVCSNGGTVNAACSHNTIACNIDTDCNDNNALTTDTCANGGALNAACAHTGTAASVTAVVPLNNATHEAFNTKITVTFSDAMDPATINTTTFTLKQGTTAVSGTVIYTGVNAVFTPTGNLAGNTIYTATVTTGARDLAGNALETSYAWSFTTGSNPDNTAPKVTGTIHVNGATNVSINTKVGATFSEAMDPLTITTVNFTLKKKLTGTLVAGAVSYTGVSAVFIPLIPLNPNTEYTVTVKGGAGGVTDLTGNPMESDFALSWTTGTTADTTAPMVTGTINANGATKVSINTKVAPTFSEAMDPLTINTTTILLKQGTTAVSGVVTYSGVTAVFIPASNLAPNTLYTATISTGAKDMAGNALAANYTWSFTTGAAPDTTAPTVTGTINANGATNVSINTKVAPTFSEAMDPLTINTTTILLKQGTTAVSGVVTYSGVTAVFIPTNTLAPNTLYTATVTTGARDMAGNALETSYTWSFTTGSAPKTTAPSVTHTIPANGSGGGTPISHKLTATFSEAMDPLTITTRTFTLRRGSATAVSGTVTYSGVIASFKPDRNLAPNALYTATITTGAKDLAGNAMTSDYVWRFTTASGADTTAPTVTLTAPANAAAGVCINKTISATFSEAMDPLTISTAHFKAAGVTGTVTYNAISKIATFTPANNLAPNTLYTVTIKNEVEDLTGNEMANNKVWTFTTGTMTCTTQ